jgi:hypothetical protein
MKHGRLTLTMAANDAVRADTEGLVAALDANRFAAA